MSEACKTDGRQERCIECLGEKKIEGNRPLEIVGVDGRLILKYTFKKSGGRVDLIDLAHGGARW
jgi:hypothetical protein